MFSQSPFQASSAIGDERLTYMLLGAQGTNRVKPYVKPQLYQLESSLSPIDTWTCRSHMAKTCNGNVIKEDGCFNSELPDGAFFRLYAEKGNKNESFPLKLYRILFEAETDGNQDIISFCPDGRSFMIHKIDDFVTSIMPKYFTSNRMASFQRQLNLYGFSKILRGPDKGGFSHSAFVKNQRNLCLTIKRKTQALKVPPHLLKGPAPEANDSPSVCPSPRGSINVGCGSPLLNQITLDTPPSPLRSASKPGDAFSPLGKPTGVSAGFSTLPSLMMCEDLRRSLQEPRRMAIPPPVPAPATAGELFILKHQIILAKERAILRQQMALAAIDRLVIRTRKNTW